MLLDVINFRTKLENAIKESESLIKLCELLKPLNNLTTKQEKKIIEILNNDKTLNEQVLFTRTKKEKGYGKNSINFILKSDANIVISYIISTSSDIIDFTNEIINYESKIKLCKEKLDFFETKNKEITFFNDTLLEIKNNISILKDTESIIIKDFYNVSTDEDTRYISMSYKLKTEILEITKAL